MRLGFMHLYTVFLLFFAPMNAFGEVKADFVLVDKSEKRLYLMWQGHQYAYFPVTFGKNPKGHKQKQGDERTPEGRYILDYKNFNSAYYKSIHISYPNAQDRKNARRMGIDPGGDIMIHGQVNGWGCASSLMQTFNWTNGCIALKDHHMDKVWEAVVPGTPIEIRP